MIAIRLSPVIVTQVPPCISWLNRDMMSPAAAALASSSEGPSNITKVTKTPTTRKAQSLTMDSVAIASIMPSWCSVASIWRVPNRMAKAASASATNSAESVRIGALVKVPSYCR